RGNAVGSRWLREPFSPLFFLRICLTLRAKGECATQPVPAKNQTSNQADLPHAGAQLRAPGQEGVMAYTGVYVFGDSLVDSGNVLKLAKLYGDLTFSDLPDGAPTTELGYYDGRFSDGFTFADLLANKVVGQVSHPTFPFGYVDPWTGTEIAPWEPDPNGISLNFAYGGAPA